MKIDLIITVERYDIASAFYPASLTTPVQNIIYGGLRLFEHPILDIYYNDKYVPDVLNIVREHLAIDWRTIYKSYITENMINDKINIIYISDKAVREFEKIIYKYDTVLITEANSVKLSLDRVLSTKNISTDVRNLTNLIFKYYSNSIEKVSSIPEIIEKNITKIREICEKINTKDYRVIIDSEVGSHVEIPKNCVLFKCRVPDFTRIREGCVIYNGAVIGCEIKNSIVDSFTHSEHYGYIGDSYLGRFVNIGAGTFFSNLKNTKGPVRYLGKHTRLSKLGPVLGDHVKTRIGSLIYSGKCIGSYSHIYGIVDRDVPPLVIYENDRKNVLDLDKLKLILDRWCRKYIGDEGVELELRILEQSYRFLLTLLEEPLSNVFFFCVE
ncbi:MAG: hypothetical protein GXO10_03660 [Crenarchaeota archaeon]|nr:hypothetical protein [Thermoproteota archaeon]